MKSEYTYIEVPASRFHRLNSYCEWLKQNIGYSGLSTWYTIQDLGGALAEKLNFDYRSSAIVFFNEHDAMYFKIACPVDQENGRLELVEDDGLIQYRRIYLNNGMGVV